MFLFQKVEYDRSKFQMDRKETENQEIFLQKPIRKL
jgi:hypothetical protein